jgi:hypothetical protein
VSGATLGCDRLEPDTVTVRGTTVIPQAGFAPVAVRRHGARLAAGLLHDFSVAELHQEHPSGEISCPDDFRLRYRGRFLEAGRRSPTSPGTPADVRCCR